MFPDNFVVLKPAGSLRTLSKPTGMFSLISYRSSDMSVLYMDRALMIKQAASRILSSRT